MNIFADKINVEEFGSHNILEALIIETEKVIYLPKSTFNVRVCFSDNEDFNAVAYEAGSHSWINVSFECVKKIFHHALLLMGRSELLPDAGIEESFDGRYRIDEFEVPEVIPFDEKYKQLVFYSGPEKPERSRVAELIAYLGIEFLLFHELGHHLGGHIRYLSDMMGISELYASHNELILENSQLYQMLETDADAIAIANLLESISTKISFYSEQFLNHHTELVPHCLVIALTIVFYLFPTEKQDHYDLEISKYLPRDVRFCLVLSIMIEKMDSEYSCCREKQSNSSLIGTLSMANAMLDELYSDSDKQNSINFDFESEEYRIYYKNTLLSKWRDIRNELEPYAVIHLPE